ncbi:hypothetical protein ASPVEDRAFT_79519 [Aspergillus versicolor CBS 583.65]|uniref:Uncharacterized protein n=1 Tax=Aspergillus versicolor CBS 583.65 TaxID=1036611 RepID=A0A1L9P8M6_ASPVE|nr:uncharacterized protein ASPVEDRAFT_79519 [Aspergillus versicolor CBS 583.65]OJI97833.1 hypothetical protein ASPVEDRAFT_79519 [Aspergillus versicolor CBS 583.65]
MPWNHPCQHVPVKQPTNFHESMARLQRTTVCHAINKTNNKSSRLIVKEKRGNPNGWKNGSFKDLTRFNVFSQTNNPIVGWPKRSAWLSLQHQHQRQHRQSGYQQRLDEAANEPMPCWTNEGAGTASHPRCRVRFFIPLLVDPVSVSGMALPGKVRGFDRIIGKPYSAIRNTELGVIITRVQLSGEKTLNHESCC